MARVSASSSSRGATLFLRQMRVRLARQMGRQLSAPDGCCNLCNRIGYRYQRGIRFGDWLRLNGGFELFKLEFELLDLATDLL
jgi:hypothetical protein